MMPLVRYEAARKALASCRSVDEVMRVRNDADRMKLYARQAKDRDLMADAVEIRLRAERQLGILIKAAKDAGQIAEGRRRKPDKNCPDAEQFPRVILEDVGIDRKLSSMAQKRASISERAFENVVVATRERILSDRAKIIDGDAINGSRAIMGSRQEPDDSLDYFPTPPWATRALCETVLPRFCSPHSSTVWEPACGEGHMAEVLAEYFRQVAASDIHDYGYGDVADFLGAVDADCGADWIITNPPFGDAAEALVLRALDLATVGVAMFVRLQWLESVGRYERIFSLYPPALIAQFAERVPLHKGRWEPDGTTATAYLWVVWLRRQNAPATALTEFFWIPPGQREALTRPDDAMRFTAHPVIRKPQIACDEPFDPESGEIVETPACEEMPA